MKLSLGFLNYGNRLSRELCTVTFMNPVILTVHVRILAHCELGGFRGQSWPLTACSVWKLRRWECGGSQLNCTSRIVHVSCFYRLSHMCLYGFQLAKIDRVHRFYRVPQTRANSLVSCRYFHYTLIYNVSLTTPFNMC